VTLEHVRKKRALRMAHLRLTQQGLNILHHFLPPKETIILLIEVGLTDDAFSLALEFDMAEQLTFVFEEVTRKCIHHQAHGSGEISRVQLDYHVQQQPFATHFTLPKRGTTVADLLWTKVQLYLSKFDNEKSGFRYRMAVARTILTTEVRMTLPLWLVALFGIPLPGFSLRTQQQANWTQAVPLLRLLLQFELVEPCARYTAMLLENFALSIPAQPQYVNGKHAALAALPTQFLLDLANVLPRTNVSASVSNRFYSSLKSLGVLA
jgi:hypothetical protein